MLKPKRFETRAGQRTSILWIYSSSIPGEVRFSARPMAGDPLTGKAELHRQRWFRWFREDFPLSHRMVLPKGMSDGDYRVYVTPDQDAEIQFEARHARAELFCVILACVLGLGIVAGTTAFILGP